jgi:hypothetical protein
MRKSRSTSTRTCSEAFEGDWQESEDKSIRLPDVSESTFRLFQHWLYAQFTRESECPAKKSKTELFSARGKPTQHQMIHLGLLPWNFV